MLVHSIPGSNSMKSLVFPRSERKYANISISFPLSSHTSGPLNPSYSRDWNTTWMHNSRILRRLNLITQLTAWLTRSHSVCFRLCSRNQSHLWLKGNGEQMGAACEFRIRLVSFLFLFGVEKPMFEPCHCARWMELFSLIEELSSPHLRILFSFHVSSCVLLHVELACFGCGWNWDSFSTDRRSRALFQMQIGSNRKGTINHFERACLRLE